MSVLSEPGSGPARHPASVVQHGSVAVSPGAAPGLYVHVPFCARVCPYCDFAVQTGGPRKRDAYVRSLLQEIRCWADREAAPTALAGSASGDASGDPSAVAGHVAEQSRWGAVQAFDSVYLGGGTPSSLALGALEEILAALRGALPVAADAELTLEANPEDINDDRLAAWRSLGVSRLSLGVQSFDAAVLDLLGRSHTPQQATAAIERSMAAGFDAVSLDLIFAVPGQTAASWESSLQRAVDLQPHHISCYELTVHQGTRFFRARRRGDFFEVSNDFKAEQFFLTHRFLAGAGYPAYEVSNFARRPEFRSRHNAKYWDHTAYLGLGPSAHSYDGEHRRWWNERRLVDWQSALDEAGSGVREEETLTAEQRVLEALALGLRTTAGVDLEHMAGRYGIDLRPGNATLVASLAGRGLLERGRGSRLVPTLEGLALADTLAGAFEIPTGPFEIPSGAFEVPARASATDPARSGAVPGADRP